MSNLSQHAKEHLLYTAQLKSDLVDRRKQIIQHRRDVIDFLKDEGYTRDVIEFVLKTLYTR